ncbi:MAG: hypothetical protein RDV48_10230 [Candidatus Eremiobacteraeota bacterium]|nr:hypothetical protein [Candidatus Eremiobacteraeota bacterium]
MKRYTTVTMAAIFLLIAGIALFYMVGRHLFSGKHIRTRSTITKYPVATVTQKVNSKEGGPDLPAGMRSFFLIRLRFAIEGLPAAVREQGASTPAPEGENPCRIEDLNVDAAIGDEKITIKGADLTASMQIVCDIRISRESFEASDSMNITVTYPGYRPVVKNDVPLREIAEEVKEAVLEKIILKRE